MHCYRKAVLIGNGPGMLLDQVQPTAHHPAVTAGLCCAAAFQRPVSSGWLVQNSYQGSTHVASNAGLAKQPPFWCNMMSFFLLCTSQGQSPVGPG